MVAPSMVTPKIPVALIDRNPRQPRKIFDPDELAELTASIKEHGVLQPIRVQPAGERFLLIAGERRLIAARLANLTEIPAVIGPVAEGREILIQAIAENVQRADMNPVDEAKAYQVLQDEFEMNVNQIAGVKIIENYGSILSGG